MPFCVDFFEPRRSRLGPFKSKFNAKNFLYAACLGLSVLDFVQFALKMCLAAQNCQMIYKTPTSMFKVIQNHCSRWQAKACVWFPTSD